MELFGRPNAAEPEIASITDFSPVDHFSFQAVKPIYTNINHEVRYSEDGRFETGSPVIWRDEPGYETEIRRVYVSPDATCIVIFQRQKLFILTQAGALLDTLSETAIATAQKYEAASLQWAGDSSCFYLLFHEVYSTDLYERSKNKSILFRYLLAGRKLEPFVYFNAEVHFTHYFLSRDNQSLYFKPLSSRPFYRLPIGEGGTFHVQIHSITGDSNTLYFYNMSCNGQPVVPVQQIVDAFDNLFVNFSRRDFGQGSAQVDSYDLKTILCCDSRGLYLSKEYQVSKVFSIQVNEEDRDPKLGPDISLYNAFFLPGNQYFILNPYAKEYQGYLVLDVATNRYAKLPYRQLNCYFSITSEDCPRMRFDFRMEPDWDVSYYRGYQPGKVNGQFTMVEVPWPQPNLRDALKAYKANEALG